MPHRAKLTQDDAPQLLALLRYIANHQPEVLENVIDTDPDTFRRTCDARFLQTYREHPLYHGLDGVDWASRPNGDYVAFLVGAAWEFIEARPTLLRLCAEKWMAQVHTRRADQRALRRAAIHAVVLRAAHEDTANVLMSWDSLAKMIEMMTGHRPGVEPTKRLFAWFDSGESPFSVVRKGQQGRFGKSTTLRVTVESAQVWDIALSDEERAATEEWLVSHDHVLGELYADEARRKLDRPQLKSRYARNADIKAKLNRLEQEAEAQFPEPKWAPLKHREEQASSPSRITFINELGALASTLPVSDPELERLLQDQINQTFAHLLEESPPRRNSEVAIPGSAATSRTAETPESVRR